MFRNFLFFFAILLIGISCSTGKESSSLVYTDYRIQKQGKTDSGLLKMLEPFSATLDASMNKVIGFSLINLNKKQPESGLGNFMADCIWLTAEKKFGRKVDAGFVNTGGIRSYIPKGNVTVGKIFELMPFDNLVVIQEVKGSVLLAFLNKTAADGGWPVSKSVTMGIKDKKAINIRIAGKPIDENGTYVIANSDYVANGGDNCEMLKKIPFVNKGYLFRDALIEFVTDLTLQGKALDYSIENRVVHVN